MTVKWKTLKRKAEEKAWYPNFIENAAPYALLMSLEQEHPRRWRDNAETLRNLFVRTIRNWDIRRAKALVDLFPDIVSRRDVGVPPVAEMAEKGEWIVVF